MVSKIKATYIYAIRYSQYLGIPCPIIMTTKAELKKFVGQNKRLPSIKKYYGKAWYNHNTIFINIRNHKNKWQLRDTVAHELLHLYNPKIPHGKKFNSLVKKIISGAE